MKKSEIQSIINTNIRNNVSLIDKNEHADVEDALLNSLYGVSNQITSDDLTDTILNKITSFNIIYNLNIVKIGGFVSISGFIGNFTGSLIQDFIFEFLIDEYKPLNITTGIATFPANISVNPNINTYGVIFATLPNNQYTNININYKTEL